MPGEPTVLRTARNVARAAAAAGVGWLLRWLAPALPRLSASEWAGCRYSFGQLGEDRLLEALLYDFREPGRYIYVDVGAHDPVNYSNTLLLYRRGWRGINIDASQESIRRFQALRPQDRNVWAAVGSQRQEVMYYRYRSPATNRVGPAGEAERENFLGEKPLSATKMMTRSLDDLLAEHVLAGERIGLLNIDCEGDDLNILRTLNWDRWRPYVVAVEAHGATTLQLTCEAMTSQEYDLVGRFLVTLLFQDRNAASPAEESPAAARGQ